MEDWKFYHSCKLASLPATVSWLLTKDMRLLGQKQRTLFLIVSADTRVSVFKSMPQFLQGDLKRNRCYPNMQWVTLLEKNSELREQIRDNGQ